MSEPYADSTKGELIEELTRAWAIVDRLTADAVRPSDERKLPGVVYRDVVPCCGTCDAPLDEPPEARPSDEVSGLDVERLLETVEAAEDAFGHLYDRRGFAEFVAAEYAALANTKMTPERFAQNLNRFAESVGPMIAYRSRTVGEEMVAGIPRCKHGAPLHACNEMSARPSDEVSGLREAAEAVCRGWFDEIKDEQDIRGLMLDLRAALAANPAPAGLDVERLAHAFNNTMMLTGEGHGMSMPFWHEVAAEYARLAGEEGDRG